MLQQLYIQNIAVIQKATIQFESGLNVFTGETGAGKTILISAVDAVLGERASRDMIRTGEEKALVSAVFEDVSPRVREKLSELGYEHEDGTVLISREITQSGKSVCKIGGIPATAAVLKEVASLLIHIHGQRDSAQLLQSENHVTTLDLFGGLSAAREEFAAAYQNMREIKGELDALVLDDTQKNRRIDMLEYQIREIDAADLSDEDEEDALLARKKIIRNSEKILTGLSEAYAALTGGGESEGIEEQFDTLVNGVSTAAEFIAEMEPMAARLSEIGYELSDFASEIRSYLDDFEFDPRELDRIESRLDTIYKLKKKYGASIAGIIAFGQRAREELDAVSTSEARAKKLEAMLQDATEQAGRLAGVLTEKRMEAAKRFTALVEAELAFLDMPSVRLSVSHEKKPMAANGADDMEFLIVTNVGELPKPLSKIVSGGEIARIMLAVKNVLADRDNIDTLIFDEVDAGVSGRAAQKIGRKLKQVAGARQVICVTHLAQVAAFADHHLLIRKEVENDRTFTRVKPLVQDEVIAELARITGGELITELSLQSARELWEHSQAAESI